MRLRTMLCLGALAVLAAGVTVHRVVRITPESLISALRRDAPPGTAAPRLLAVLDSLRTEHSQPYYAKTGDSQIREPGRRLNAAIRDLRRGKLLAEGVFLTVALDADDRVVDYRAEYVYTGP
jgi:hypothetical protein